MLTLLSTVLFLSPFAQEPAPCPSQKATAVAQPSECQKSCDQMTVAAKKQCHTSSEMDAALASLNRKLAERDANCSSKMANCSDMSPACESEITVVAQAQPQCPAAAAKQEYEVIVLRIDEMAGGTACASKCESEAAAQVVVLEAEACESECAAACEEAIAMQLVANAESKECCSSKATPVAAETACCKSDCDAEAVAVELVSNDTEECCGGCETACDGKATAKIVALESEACESECAAACEETIAMQLVANAESKECCSSEATPVAAETACCKSACDTEATAVELVNNAFKDCCGGCETACDTDAAVEVVALEAPICEAAGSECGNCTSETIALSDNIVMATPVIASDEIIELRTRVASVKSADLQERMAKIEARLQRIEMMLERLASQL